MLAITTSSHAPPKVGGFLSHLEGYGKSLDGVRDFSDATDIFAKLAKACASDSSFERTCDKVSNGFGLIRDSLSIPAFLAGLTGLSRNISDLVKTYRLPETDMCKEKKVASAVKRMTQESIGLVCSGSESAMFLDKVELLPLPETAARVCETIFWGAAGVLDGWDLCDQLANTDRYLAKSRSTRDPRVADYYIQKNELAHVYIIKDITTVAAAALSLVSIFFASFVAGLTFLPAVLLGLSCVYIVSKIAAYFYQRMLDDQQKLLEYAISSKI